MAQIRKAFSSNLEDSVAVDWLRLVEEFATVFGWVHAPA